MKATLLLIAIIPALGTPITALGTPAKNLEKQPLGYSQDQTTKKPSPAPEDAIKVTIANEDLPETVLLKPNESRPTDWFVLVDDSRQSTGAEAWYDALPPDKYELSIQQRLGCCAGPMIQSNKMTFEVVP